MTLETAHKRAARDCYGACRVCGGPAGSPYGVCRGSAECRRVYGRESARRGRRARERVAQLEARLAGLTVPSEAAARETMLALAPGLGARVLACSAARLIAVLSWLRYRTGGELRIARWGLIHGAGQGAAPHARPRSADFVARFRPVAARAGIGLTCSSLSRWVARYMALGPAGLVDGRGRPLGPGAGSLPRKLVAAALADIAAGWSVRSVAAALHDTLAARGGRCPAAATLAGWLRRYRGLRVHGKKPKSRGSGPKGKPPRTPPGRRARPSAKTKQQNSNVGFLCARGRVGAVHAPHFSPPTASAAFDRGGPLHAGRPGTAFSCGSGRVWAGRGRIDTPGAGRPCGAEACGRAPAAGRGAAGGSCPQVAAARPRRLVDRGAYCTGSPATRAVTWRSRAACAARSAALSTSAARQGGLRYGI